MDNCIICLETGKDITSGINTLSQEWLEGNIQRIIEKHLWWWYMKPLTAFKEQHIRWICCQCIREVTNFHDFYCKVEMMHKNYDKIAENLENNGFKDEQKQEDVVIKYEVDDSEITTEEMMNLSTSPNEQLVKIKSGTKDEEENIIEVKQEISYSDNDDDNVHIKEENVWNAENLNEESYGSNVNYSGVSTKVIDSFTITDISIKDESTKIVETQNINENINSAGHNNMELSNTPSNEDILNEHKLECHLCSEPLTDFRTLKVHFRNEHHTEGYAMCCGNKFTQRYLFIDHLQVHKNPDFFKCPSCGKSFTTRRSLEKHVKSHKARERNFHCDECNKSFLEQRTLDWHKLKHLPESERNFNCTQCEKKFASEYLRRQHITTFHDKKYSRSCDLCGKSFSRKHAYIQHMEEHAGATPSFETCEICGAKLSNKSNLKQHIKLQHLEKDLNKQTCPYCSKVSPNPIALRVHINYVHKMERKHICEYCNKAFARPLQLKEHMGTHTGEALFECSYCARTFMSHANMYKHQKTMHRQEWEENRLKKSGKRSTTATCERAFDDVEENLDGGEMIEEHNVI